MEQPPLPAAPSLGKTISDIFTAPSDAFDGLATSAPSAKLWLLPFLLTLLLAVTTTIVIFNTEVLRTQVMEQQQKQLDKSLQEGKISQDRYDQTISQMERMGPMFVVIGSVAAIIFVSLMFFLYTLLLWLADKFILKATVGYTKHLELYGISMWISILGSIIAIAMMVGLGSITAGPSAALIVMNEFDPSNKIHGLLAALNIFSLWQTATVGFGLSKFSGKSTGISLTVSYGLWAVWIAILIVLGMAR